MSALLLSVITTAHTGTAPAGEIEGASGLLTALVGGAVGVIITALARALGIPSDVRAHDAAIRDRDDALATWTADRNYELEQASKAIRAEVNPNPGERIKDGSPEDAFHTVATAGYKTQARKADIAIAAARSDALHEYRDEERRARLDRATILAAEGWAHRLWRRVGRDPAPALETPTKAVPVLNSWREPSQMSGERPVHPDDATERTLDHAIAAVRATGP